MLERRVLLVVCFSSLINLLKNELFVVGLNGDKCAVE